MADEIKYVVKEIDEHDVLIVTYTMGEHTMDVRVPWSGWGEIEEHLQRHAPREELRALTRDKPDLHKLKGRKGHVDLDPALPEVEPIPERKTPPPQG